MTTRKFLILDSTKKFLESPVPMTPSPIREFVPYLSIRGAGSAIEFYSQVFGIAPHVHLAMPDGRVMHCEFRIGNSRFYLSEELPEHGGTPSPTTTGNTTVAIHLYVDDCDKVLSAMSEQGAKILMEATDMFWGERFARVRDPFGHEWGIASIIREMTPDEIQSEAEKLFKQIAEDE